MNKDKYDFNNGGAYTKRKKWTNHEIQQLINFKKNKIPLQDIAKKLDRTEVSVSLKWKRLGKTTKRYNKNHLIQKYDTNTNFINLLQPNTVLDLYAGEYSYYTKLREELIYLNENTFKNIITNDKNKNFIQNDYNLDALK